jgi:hypothetical protein
VPTLDLSLTKGKGARASFTVEKGTLTQTNRIEALIAPRWTDAYYTAIPSPQAGAMA